MRLKLSTTCMIFKKLQSVSVSSLNKISTGKVVNVVANDLAHMDRGDNLPNIFVIPFVVLFTFYFLWTLYGAYFLLFLLAFVVTGKFQKYMAGKKRSLLLDKMVAGD